MYMRWNRLRVQGGATPTIKNHTATAISRRELLVFGGYDGRHNHNELFLFDCEARTWRELTHVARGAPPAGRNGHTATLAEHKLFIIGGWLGSGPLAAADLHVLHLPTLTWQPPPRVRGSPPGPCNMHTADYLPHLRSILVFRGGDGREYLNDLHALSIDTMEWRQIHASGELPAPRANHSSAVVGDAQTLLVFGGWDGQKRLNDIHVLDTRCFTWSRVRGTSNPWDPEAAGDELVPRAPPHPRAGMTLACHRDMLFLFGGSGPSATCYNDLHVYDPEDHEWLDMIVTEEEGGRSAACAGGAAEEDLKASEAPWMRHQETEVTLSGSFTGERWRSNSSSSSGRRRRRLQSTNTQEYRDDGDDDDDDGADDDDDDECFTSRDDARRMTQPYGIDMYEEEDDEGSYELYDRGGHEDYCDGNPANPNDTIHIHPRRRRRLPRAPIVVVGKGPGRRAGHTCTVVDRKLFIFGGSYGSEYLNDFYELDTDPPPCAEISLASSTQLLQRSLGQFVNNEEFADISFLVEGRVVFAHKLILSLLSERFRVMFSSGFREASEKQIQVPDVRYVVFVKMMEYLYTGEAVAEDRWHGERRASIINSAEFSAAGNGQEPLASPSGGYYQQCWGLPQLEAQTPNGNEFSAYDAEAHERGRGSSWPQEEPVEYASASTRGWPETPQDGDWRDPFYEEKRHTDAAGTMAGAERGSLMGDDEFEVTLELLVAADQFMLDHLKQVCERALQHAVCRETVECLLEAAEGSNAMQLRAVCLHFMRNHAPLPSVDVFDDDSSDIVRLDDEEDEEDEEEEEEEGEEEEEEKSKRLSATSDGLGTDGITSSDTASGMNEDAFF